MHSETTTSNQNQKQKQNRFFMVCAIVLGIFLIFLSLVFTKQEKKKPLLENSNTLTSATPLQHVDAPSIIIQQAENRLIMLQKDNQVFQKQLQTLQQAKQAENAHLEKQSMEMQQLIQRLDTIEKKFAQPTTLTTTIDKNTSDYLVSPLKDNITTRENNRNFSDKIRIDSVSSLSSITKTSSIKSLVMPTLKTPETYVPSGTFAKAVMLGGADASAAVNSQSNPTPMLFRIVEEGTLPNQHRSHLKDCFVTAAVMGDISSERGQIRLETLSCTKPNNTIIDMAVQGTVFGPEGKNGVRGIPVWREGAVLQRAFAAGALSGLAEGLSQQYTTNAISPLGNTQSINPSGIFQYGAAQGANNAMTKLADYNIHRAEQYHPIIQLSAGTLVDIVFLKGFYLNGQQQERGQDLFQKAETENILMEASNHAPLQQDEKENLSPLPLTEEQITRLKDHDTKLGFNVSTQTTS